MKKMMYFIALIAANISLGSYAATANSPSDNSVYTEDKVSFSVTDKQPEFTLKLKSNPTTGYSWFLREYNSALISPVKHSFIQGANKNLIGASGFEMWTFRVKPSAFTVPQQTLIRMVYARPWQAADNSTQIVFRIATVSTK